MDVLRVRQLAGRADDAAVEREGRRDGGRGREMVHQLRGDPRVLQVLLDLRGVGLVDLLRRRRCGGCAEGATLPRRSLGPPTRHDFQPMAGGFIDGLLRRHRSGGAADGTSDPCRVRPTASYISGRATLRARAGAGLWAGEASSRSLRGAPPGSSHEGRVADWLAPGRGLRDGRPRPRPLPSTHVLGLSPLYIVMGGFQYLEATLSLRVSCGRGSPSTRDCQ